MPTPIQQAEKLRRVSSLRELIPFLRDELDWPIDQDASMEGVTYEYDTEELGIDTKYADAISEVRQLRPLANGQPWGIFWVSFRKKALPVVVLRKILASLVEKKRASAGASERASWKEDDLLFISAYGEEESRELAIAHFEDPKDGTKPSLKVLQWDASDTTLKLERVLHDMQEKLRWHEEYQADPERWRREWASAFRNRVGHVIRTSDKLADALAGLARRIRDRAIEAMKTESDRGSLRRLLKAFQESLIHDLDEDGFADTYAQTVTYGLLTAAFSRTEMSEGRHGTAFEAEDITHMVPVTNPFLKEMLGAFLTVGGRKGKIDFDELGIGDVVELLKGDETDLPAIMADFGNKTRGEDPVIHFYEHFLAAYNKKLKVQRGVFYTPQPVVSYIVRSVHELLQTEFGLEDGLASTATWGEMMERLPDLKLPTYTDEKGTEIPVSKDEPFVLILDPATGTATFIVETIDVIYRHLTDKWKKARMSDAQRAAAWNEYVPKHLLPRLFAYELMMAPYAIAHMKVGLKLAETGYQFGSDERVRIYLTNALEPAQQQLRLPDFEPLAHEAEAVNQVKREKRFTVVIGNPPYSLLSANLEPHHRMMVEHYKYVNGVRIHERGALQMEKNLNDDYVKFIRLTQLSIDRTGVGLFGLITNHSFLDNPTMRGVRWSLLHSATRMWLYDLHGNSTKQEKSPDGSEDVNVFQIKQGVAIALSIRLPGDKGSCDAKHNELWGTRQSKESWLGANYAGGHKWKLLEPTPEHFLFVPQSSSLKSEFEAWPTLPDMMPTNGAGYITARDNLVIDIERDAVIERVRDFNASRQDDASLLRDFEVADKKGWDVKRARSELKHIDIPKRVIRTNYRPFDSRWIFFDSTLVWGRSWPTMKHVIGHAGNPTLLATRMTKDQWDVWVARTVSSHKAMSAYDTNSVFPLYLVEDAEELQQCLASQHRINFSTSFQKSLSRVLGLHQRGAHGLPSSITAEDIFHYAYGVFRSPSYRSRYAEFLKIDFPRLPLTESLDLFKELSRLGGELVALHLLESKLLEKPRTTFIGSKDQEIQKISFKDDTVFIDKAQTSGFEGVPEKVWNFHIGGYQVCEKWLKDRKGRTLSEMDIAHYHKIVISLQETIRLMAEIDQVIEKHGGWPGAFATTKPPEDTPDQPAPAAPKVKAKTKPSVAHNDLGLHLEGELPL